jgi:hypothetical protein
VQPVRTVRKTSSSAHPLAIYIEASAYELIL